MDTLPKISYQTFEVTLPSNGKVIKMRPFLVKEEKILLLAQESKSHEQLLDAIKQVINNCVLSSDVKINKLPVFDVTWIWIQLRINSVGDSQVLQIRHNDDFYDPETDEVYTINSDGKKCDHAENVVVDLKQCYIKKDPNHTNKIKLTDDIAVVMKYPTEDTQNLFPDTNSAIKLTFNLITYLIDQIYDKESVYDSKDFSMEKMEEFVENLPRECLTKIWDTFFETLPKINIDIEYKCSSCGCVEKRTIENIQDFFI